MIQPKVPGLVWDAWRAERGGQVAVTTRQRGRLAELIRFARARSPLYRDLYRHLPADVTDPRLLPPVTKAELMARFDEWATDPTLTRGAINAFMADETRLGRRLLGRYAVWRTSGITGEPGILVHDVDAVALYRALTLLRGWLPWITPRGLAAMLRQGNRVATVIAGGSHYSGASMMAAARRDHPRPFNRVRVFSAFSPVPELVRALNDFRPALLLGYPSALTILAGEQRAGRLQIRPSLVGSGGEWLAPSARRGLEEAFGCTVRENYGTAEFPPLAWECRQRSLHLGADWVILEPVDEQYRPVPPGEASHTSLLTNLANRIQPLIRFELGDTITLGRAPCACASPLPTVRVEGRRNEILLFQTPGGETVPMLPLVLTSALLGVPGVQRRQVVQIGPATLKVRLEVESGADQGRVWDAALHRLLEQLAAHGLPHVRAERAPEPPMPHPVSGKFRHVWSELDKTPQS